MIVEILEDGTLRSINPPSRAMIKNYPSYGEWMTLLLSRGAAVRYKGVGGRDETKATDQRFTLGMDGEVTLQCLCCSIPTSKLKMQPIRIGGLVRFQDEEEVMPKQVEVKTILKPISKTGLGCSACSILMQVAQGEVNIKNAALARAYQIESEIADNTSQVEYLIAVMGGMTPLDAVKRTTIKIKTPTPRVAWIDMFPRGWRDKFDI